MNDDDDLKRDVEREDERESEDDALEDTRAGSHFNPDTDEEKLEGDYNSPGAPADDIPGPRIPQDDPRTDSGLDEDEVYSEGLDKATDTTEEKIVLGEGAEPLEPED